MGETEDLLKLLGIEVEEDEEPEIEQPEYEEAPTCELNEREAFTPISYGSRGVTWSAKPGVLGEDAGNPLMFTCSICLKEVEAKNWKDAHRKGCKNLLINSLGL
jgi:hypothetical protein